MEWLLLQDTPRAHPEISSLLRPQDRVKRATGGNPPGPVLCLRFSGSIFVMPLTAVFAVATLIVGVAIGYWIRNQIVRAEILAEKQNNENLAKQFAERERSLEQARKE